MRSKTPLAMMELLVMLLVFALAAALCVQVFVFADGDSRRDAARDRALAEVQNAAECLKSLRGDYAAAAQILGGAWDGACWTIAWDEDWTPVPEAESVYRLEGVPETSGTALLGSAELTAYTAAGEALCALRTAWQEVDVHG